PKNRYALSADSLDVSQLPGNDTRYVHCCGKCLTQRLSVETDLVSVDEVCQRRLSDRHVRDPPIVYGPRGGNQHRNVKLCGELDSRSQIYILRENQDNFGLRVSIGNPLRLSHTLDSA